MPPRRRRSARRRTPARTRRAAPDEDVAADSTTTAVEPHPTSTGDTHTDEASDAQRAAAATGTGAAPPARPVWRFLLSVFRLALAGCILVMFILPIQPLRFVVCSLNQNNPVQPSSAFYVHGFCGTGQHHHARSNIDHFVGAITSITVFQGTAIWLSILSSQLGDQSKADFASTRKKVAETIRVSTVAMVFAFMLWDFSVRDAGAVFVWASALRHTVYIPLVYSWYYFVINMAQQFLEMYLRLGSQGRTFEMWWTFATVPAFLTAMIWFAAHTFNVKLYISGSGPKVVIILMIYKQGINWGLSPLRRIGGSTKSRRTRGRRSAHCTATSLPAPPAAATKTAAAGTRGDAGDGRDRSRHRERTNFAKALGSGRAATCLRRCVAKLVMASVNPLIYPKDWFVCDQSLLPRASRAVVRCFSELVFDLPEYVGSLLRDKLGLPTEALYMVFVRLPFTHNFILLAVLYGFGLFNILLHLLAATTAEVDDVFTSACKFAVLYCLANLALPLLFHLVAMAQDSWADLPHTSRVTIKLIENVSRFVSGTSSEGNDDDDDDDDDDCFPPAAVTGPAGTAHSRRRSRAGSVHWKKAREHALSTSKPEELESQETKDNAMFDLVRNSTRLIVWFVFTLFFAAAILVKSKVFENMDAVMRLNVDVPGQVFIDHGVGGVRLCDGQHKNCHTDPGIERDSPSSPMAPRQPAVTTPYAICNLRWQNLSSLDYALLANFAYFDSQRMERSKSAHQLYVRSPEVVHNVEELVRFAFPREHYGKVSFVDDTQPRRDDDHQNVNTVAETPEECYNGRQTRSSCRKCNHRPNYVQRYEEFMRFDFHDLKTTVIAIKGTSPVAIVDLFADARLWSETVLFSTASAVLPILRLMPAGMVARLIRTMQHTQKFFEVENIDLDLYENIVRYTHCLRDTLPDDWNISVTGHSLGGGLATIVGTSLGLDAIAFSPPGLTQSRFKFVDPYLNETHPDPRRAGRVVPLRPRLGGGRHTGGAAQHSVNIIPTRDLVPSADYHFGLTQNTICVKTDPLYCHQLELAVCDLLTRCGDGHGGRRFSGCTYEKLPMINVVNRDSRQRASVAWANWKAWASTVFATMYGESHDGSDVDGGDGGDTLFLEQGDVGVAAVEARL